MPKHRRMPVFARSPVTGWLACAYGVRCGSVPVKTASDQKDCANRNWCPDRRGNEAEALICNDPVCHEGSIIRPIPKDQHFSPGRSASIANRRSRRTRGSAPRRAGSPRTSARQRCRVRSGCPCGQQYRRQHGAGMKTRNGRSGTSATAVQVDRAAPGHQQRRVKNRVGV